ncbi:hypothetical protein B0H11DRAFT_479760 [Mycena galericulata]|nr:hypothetical protein B0H11DRAFT_479760 [Mycena galericulata]
MDLLLALVVLLALPALWIFYLLYSNASLGRKLTYATLARSTIFPRIDCNTETGASARYTARFPADDLPRFAYNDPHLASYAISKFDKAIEALGVQNRACPGDSAVLWKVVTRHIVKGGYTREDCASSLMSHISSFLGFLLEDLLPDAELFTRYPALWASQKGDLNFIVETTKGRGITGIKCTKVLDKLDHELTTATVFPEGSLQHAQGILMKMGLQLQDLQRTSVTTARFGVIVSGTDCYVVELGMLYA